MQHGGVRNDTYAVESVLELGFFVLWLEAGHVSVWKCSTHHLEVLLGVESGGCSDSDAGHPRDHG